MVGRAWSTKSVTIWVRLVVILLAWLEVSLPLDTRLSMAVVSSPTRAVMTSWAVLPFAVATWAIVLPD